MLLKDLNNYLLKESINFDYYCDKNNCLINITLNILNSTLLRVTQSLISRLHC